MADNSWMSDRNWSRTIDRFSAIKKDRALANTRAQGEENRKTQREKLQFERRYLSAADRASNDRGILESRLNRDKFDLDVSKFRRTARGEGYGTVDEYDDMGNVAGEAITRFGRKVDKFSPLGDFTDRDNPETVGRYIYSNFNTSEEQETALSRLSPRMQARVSGYLKGILKDKKGLPVKESSPGVYTNRVKSPSAPSTPSVPSLKFPERIPLPPPNAFSSRRRESFEDRDTSWVARGAPPATIGGGFRQVGGSVAGVNRGVNRFFDRRW